MASFIETRFPELISRGSSGGPEFKTLVDEVDSAKEYRSPIWPIGRHRYNAALGVKTLTDYQVVRDLFHAVQGKAIGFRWRDHLDHKTSADPNASPTASDQSLGTGTGIGGTHQLIKRYSFGGIDRDRDLLKPVAGTWLVEGDGSPLVEGTDYSIDYTTGVLTELVDLSGQALTGGGYFDVPVRFDTDQLLPNIVDRQDDGEYLVSVDVPIVEIIPH